MTELPFHLDLLQFLVDHRTPFLTTFFQLATFLGEVEGYVLVVTLVYVAWDKRLAFRLGAVVLVTMCLNHVLKILIQNPRPFITQGTFAEKWAVSAEKAQELATEYSTPSGHAMSAAAFYSLLYAGVRNRSVRIFAVLAIVLTGLSRPYLAVHYLEDVLLGWLIGFLLILFLLKRADAIGRLWNARSYAQQVLIAVVSSLALWLMTLALNGGSIDQQPVTFMGYAGFLTGIVIAYPLEVRWVNFDPRSSSAACKALRYVLSVGLVIATISGLDVMFAQLSDDATATGHLLRYLRYVAAGTVGMLVAPMVFTKLGLAEPHANGTALAAA